MNGTYDADTHTGLRRYFDDGNTRPYDWRMKQLRALDHFLREREASIAAAAYADLKKPAAETWLTETGYLRSEIRYALRNLHRWMRPRRVRVPLLYQPASASVERNPLGVVLIIGAWNYPLQLNLAPLVSSLAAGNCAVVKPSELAPATSRLLADQLVHYLDHEALKVIEGDGDATASMLEYRFDHIFFTGSRRKGQAVMMAAARHLTPVTLELGGKSPCVVTEKADLRTAARRIVWAKFLNAGQTCVAPDYLLVQESVETSLLRLIKEALRHFFGSDPEVSPDYGRIVDARNFTRLESLVHEASFIEGGRSEAASRYIEPAIVRNVPHSSRIMQEEIFGPILPVLTFSGLAEAVSVIRSHPDPIAVYLFSRDSAELLYLKEHTRSGGVCCNDLLFQAAVSALPFGGRGESGIGSYHGQAGFETFTVPRSVLSRSSFPDPDLRYPPYGRGRFAFLKRIVTLFS